MLIKLVAVCHNKRIRANKVFKGMAEIGNSTMSRFYGFKLHLACNNRGELLNFYLTKGNTDDRNPDVFNVLSLRFFRELLADKGYISEKLFDTLWDEGIHLVIGIKSNMKNQLMGMREKYSEPSLLHKKSLVTIKIPAMLHAKGRTSQEFQIRFTVFVSSFSVSSLSKSVLC